MVLTPGERVDISGEPSPMDRVAVFEALLECTADADGTRVRRCLEFRFARPLAWLLDPLFTRWLARDIAAELGRLKAHLERESRP